MNEFPHNLPWLHRDAKPVRVASGSGPYTCKLQCFLADGTPGDDPVHTGDFTVYDPNGIAHNVDEILWVKRLPNAAVYIVVGGSGGGTLPTPTGDYQVVMAHPYSGGPPATWTWIADWVRAH